jgi:hypothetical protein
VRPGRQAGSEVAALEASLRHIDAKKQQADRLSQQAQIGNAARLRLADAIGDLQAGVHRQVKQP